MILGAGIVLGLVGVKDDFVVILPFTASIIYI